MQVVWCDLAFALEEGCARRTRHAESTEKVAVQRVVGAPYSYECCRDVACHVRRTLLQIVHYMQIITANGGAFGVIFATSSIPIPQSVSLSPLAVYGTRKTFRLITIDCHRTRHAESTEKVWRLCRFP